jgi:hydrogenase-4 component F
MHTWLPDAHSQAPSPVCALLSGVETTAVLYVVLRLLSLLPQQRQQAWALVFGLVSVGVASFLLLQVRDYKRLFAFSTVEHMGIVLAAVGLGASAGRYAAMAQIVNHSITKSFCFFAAGAVLLAVETREIAAVRGLLRTSPAAAVALLFGGLAIAGAPPLAVFMSEFSILRAGLAQGHYVATGLLALFIAVAFFGVLLHINRMVFGASATTAPSENFRLPFSCGLTLVLAAVPVLVLGLYMPQSLHDLLALAATALAK